MQSHPARVRARRACVARPSSCACRSGGSVSGSNGIDQDGELGAERGAAPDHGGELDGLRGRRHDHERRVTGRGCAQAGERGTDGADLGVRDPREGLEEPFLRQRGGRRVGRGEPEREAAAREQDPQGGRDRDRPLERLPVRRSEHPLAGVQEHQPVGAPRRFVLADHQLAGAGDARPVDPAEVVALVVLAHRVVLLAGPEQVPRPRGAHVRPERRVRRAGQVLDLRGDDELLALVELQPLSDQGERVGHVDRQRPQLVPAARLRQDGVRDPLGAVSRDAGDHQPGRPAERGRQPILEQQERRGGGRAVLDVDLHRHAGPRRDADVGERPVDRDPLPSPANEERRDRRQRGQAERDDLQAGGADDPCGQPHGESGEQDGHPAAGRHQGFSATGTGTSARISSRMTWGDRPLMTASAVTMIRWASTGMASAFTSSGIT